MGVYLPSLQRYGISVECLKDCSALHLGGLKANKQASIPHNATEVCPTDVWKVAIYDPSCLSLTVSSYSPDLAEHQ